MNRIIIVIGIVAFAVGGALIQQEGAVSMGTLADAAAIALLVAVLSLHTWLNDRLFSTKVARRGRTHRNPRLPARAGDGDPKRRGDDELREVPALSSGSRAGLY